MNTQTRRFISVQSVFLILYLLINVTLFYSAELKTDPNEGFHPTFWNASDGQRYWGVARNLADSGMFLIGEDDVTPLKRAGPLPALIFSIPMMIVEFQASAGWIVGIQCLILFLASLAGRKICEPFGISKDLFQAALIFNPLLINLAHHAQSDLIFAAIITVMLSLITVLLTTPNTRRMPIYLLLGLTCGFLPLARPLGLYVVIVLPFVLLIAMFFLYKSNILQLELKSTLAGFAVAGFVAIIVVSPWAIRNYQVFDKVSLTHSEGIMIEWHHKMLRKRSGMAHDIEKKLRALERYGVSKDCLNDPKCKEGISKAYLSLMFSASSSELGEGIVRSWIHLFLGGGFKQVSQYLGLHDHSLNHLLVDKGQDSTSRKLSSERTNLGLSYLALASLMLGYPLIMRAFGLIGVWGLLRRRKELFGLVLIHFMIIGIFLAMYLFSGIPRFRAPLEPSLTLFAVMGVSAVMERFRKQPLSQDSRLAKH